MAILIEGITLVICNDQLPSICLSTQQQPRNATDNTITGFYFSDIPNATAFANTLAKLTKIDIAWVDQKNGPLQPVAWLENGYLTLQQHQTVAACRHRNDNSDCFATPAGWQYAGSITEKCGFQGVLG